jgi:hypothetical protein
MGSVEPESARVVATARRRSASDIGVISELKVALVPPLNRTELHPTTPLFHRWLGSDQRGRALLICGGFPKSVLQEYHRHLSAMAPDGCAQHDGRVLLGTAKDQIERMEIVPRTNLGQRTPLKGCVRPVREYLRFTDNGWTRPSERPSYCLVISRHRFCRLFVFAHTMATPIAYSRR